MPEAHLHVALVTASSRGLGRVIALRLAREGLAVAVNGLHDDTQTLDLADSSERSGGVAAPFGASFARLDRFIDLIYARRSWEDSGPARGLFGGGCSRGG